MYSGTEKPPVGDNYCPICGDQLQLESMNISEGVALCTSCGQLSRLSDVVNHTRPVTEIIKQPPGGCSLTEWGQEFVVQATLRSIGAFLGMLAVNLFWNGIVSIFVLVAIAGLYTNLVGPLPKWFPAPDMKGEMPLGMTLFLCVFLLPFLAIGAVLIASLVMTAAGKVVVTIGSTAANVATGLGFLMWRRHFDPARVRRVSIGQSSWQSNGQSTPQIVIEADRTIKFGSLLGEDRREWVQTVLQELLRKQTASERREIAHLVRREGMAFDPRDGS